MQRAPRGQGGVQAEPPQSRSRGHAPQSALQEEDEAGLALLQLQCQIQPALYPRCLRAFFPPPRGVLAAPVPFLPAGEEPLLRTRCYFQNKEGAGAVATLGEGMLAALNFQISQRPALPGISNAELALRSRYRKALFCFFPFFFGFVSVPPSHT